MNFNEFMDEWKKTKAENDRRTAEKFAECKRWVESHLFNCGVVWTNHEKDLQEQRFLIWCDLGGMNISHNYLNLTDCEIAPLELLPLPEHQY